MEKINLADKFEKFNEYWSPRIICELNNQYVKLAKFKGEMIWHSHDNEDEFFQVIKGAIKIHFRDKTIELNEGECAVVPKGVEHKPEAASEEAYVLFFEPKETTHTGSTICELTKEISQQPWI